MWLSFIFFHFHMCGFDIHLGIGYEVVTGSVTIEFTVDGLGIEYAKYRHHSIGRFPDGYTIRFYAIILLGLRTNILLWMH